MSDNLVGVTLSLMYCRVGTRSLHLRIHERGFVRHPGSDLERSYTVNSSFVTLFIAFRTAAKNVSRPKRARTAAASVAGSGFGFARRCAIAIVRLSSHYK